MPDSFANVSIKSKKGLVAADIVVFLIYKIATPSA